MANPPKRVYWDACTWIALIHKEKIRDVDGNVSEDRETLCRSVLYAAQAGKIEIVTSTWSLVEVCKNPNVKAEGEDRIASFFEHDYITLVNLDRFAGERARELMLSGLSRLKPADAAHVASAALTDVDEFHTFDQDVIRLSGLIDKANASKLVICKPGSDAAPAPLLDRMPNLLLGAQDAGAGGSNQFKRVEKTEAMIRIAAILRQKPPE